MRSLLPSVLVFVVAAINLLHLGGVQSLKQNKFSYRTNSPPSISLYQNLLAELRVRLSSGSDSHGFPITRPVQNIPLGERFIELKLESSNGEVITVIIDTWNVYVVGYYETRSSSSLRPTLHYLLRTPPELLQAFPSTQYAHNRLDFGGEYNNLPARGEHEIGHGALNNAITNLYYGNSRPNGILVIIQMVSEAVRIRYMENLIVRHMSEGNQNFRPDPMALRLQNSWSKLSDQVQLSGESGVFPTPIEFRNSLDQYVIIQSVADLLRYAALSLVLLTTCRPPRLVADEQCLYRERTINIIGREGQCMEVKDGNNGIPIILRRCGNHQRNQQWTFKSDGTIRSNGRCLTTFRNPSPGNYISIFDCVSIVPASSTKWILYNGGTIMNLASGLVITAQSSARGTELILADDNNSSSQAWSAKTNTHPTVTYISGLNGMCLQANGANARVWLANCVISNTNRNQQWVLYGDSTIRLFSDPSLCVTSNGDESRNSIILLNCQGSRNQRWRFMPDGTILNPNARLVMDVRGSDASLRDIILYHPTGNPNQKWFAF